MGEEPRRWWRKMDRSQVQVLGLVPKALRPMPDCSRSDLTVVYQRRSNDCGFAALATVAAHHRRHLSVEDLTPELLDRDGTDLLTLSRIAKRLGLRTQGVKVSYDAIQKCALPAIAHMRCLL